MIQTIIEEMMHAKLRESAVLLVGVILINAVSNKMTIMTILASCSINSVKLIAKNFFSPHSAPRKTS